MRLNLSLILLSFVVALYGQRQKQPSTIPAGIHYNNFYVNFPIIEVISRRFSDIDVEFHR